MDYEKLKPALEKQDAIRKQYGVRIYIPLLVLVALMVIFKVLKLGEDIGMPLMFLSVLPLVCSPERRSMY